MITHTNVLSDKAKQRQLSVLSRDLEAFLQEVKIPILPPYYIFEAEEDDGDLQGLKQEVLKSQIYAKFKLKTHLIQKKKLNFNVMGLLQSAMRWLMRRKGKMFFGFLFLFSSIYLLRWNSIWYQPS